MNLQGDVLRLVNASGVTVASYDYDPYGNILSATGTLANLNPLRYRGYYYDPETGFYYLQSRYYDPAIGRFLNADSYASTGQSFLGYDMFSYCLNNPTSNCDPAGTRVVCTVGVSNKRLSPGSTDTGRNLNELNSFLRDGGGQEYSNDPFERALFNDGGKGTYTVTKQENMTFHRAKENEIFANVIGGVGDAVSFGSTFANGKGGLALGVLGDIISSYGDWLNEPGDNQIIPEGLICTKYEITIEYEYGNDIGQRGKNIFSYYIYYGTNGQQIGYLKSGNFEMALFNWMN